MSDAPRGVPVLWRGKLAMRVTGWTIPKDHDGDATTIVVIDGRRYTALASEVKAANSKVGK